MRCSFFRGRGYWPNEPIQGRLDGFRFVFSLIINEALYCILNLVCNLRTAFNIWFLLLENCKGFVKKKANKFVSNFFMGIGVSSSSSSLTHCCASNSLRSQLISSSPREPSSSSKSSSIIPPPPHLHICLSSNDRVNVSHMNHDTIIIYMMHVSRSSSRTTKRAVRMLPISPQTVMSAMYQPSLEPAVPLGLVAPATCPSSQRDPEDASGTDITCTSVFKHVSFPMM